MSKRECLLLTLFGGGNGVCRLNVYLLWSAIDHKVNLVLSYRVLASGIVVALYNADINGISTSDKFVVDGIFHKMCELWLTEVDSCISKTGIGGVVFNWIVEVTASLDIKSLSFAD